MSLYSLPNSTGGIDLILADTFKQVPAIPIMFTLFIFAFVFIVGMGAQMRRTGYSDTPMWATLGLLSATFLNLIFSLAGGIINPFVLGVLVALTIFSALWLFFSRGRFEQ